MRYLGDLAIHQPPAPPPPPHHHDQATRGYYDHGSAKRVFTDAVIIDAISKQYPELNVTVIPVRQIGVMVDLLQFAALGFAKATPVGESNMSPLKDRLFALPARRTDAPVLLDDIKFGKYMYEYKNNEFILYVADCRDLPYVVGVSQFLVGATKEVADDLLTAAGRWASELHGEVWEYDGGYWDKSAELFDSVNKSSWEDVILDDEMKTALQEDVYRFFQSKQKYDELRVPWKRGIIYHGPPGNGKTISIKAMMNTLYHWKNPIPALYVRSFRNIFGPEESIKEIFSFARSQAPCLLIFEDLDSLVRDEYRSYFLNEVDGISQSLGVCMIGSTNHLDQLDPGLSKRPSRFDRKFAFLKPNFDERVKYCEYWREKLKDNKDIDFPHKLSKAVAEITDDFSFAYMQEAFVAALLALASKSDTSKDKDDLDDLILWQEIKKQVKILKDEM